MATIHELTITASIPASPINIGGGVLVINAETLNGAIPGPTIRLTVGDTLIVRLINNLSHPTGIHWHGIELQNSADGTPTTQNGVPAGGTFLYKFIVPRPGIFWYHPHHHHSTNRVFRGQYGMIVVTDPDEEALVTSGVLPSALNTRQLILSDITVCKSPGANDIVTYVDPTTLPAADRAEWLSPGTTEQTGSTPLELCEIPTALDDHGDPAIVNFSAGEIPGAHNVIPGRTVEGQTVLTNGANVGGRLGTPAAPGALLAGATTINVQPGQGLRFQIVNSAILRYFRLILSTSTGVQIPLIRVGGEGGVLNDAIIEGGVIAGFDTRYFAGEILIPPASRADVVAVIPTGATGVCTMWTRDFQRTGPSNPGNWAQLPTVPVLHLNVTGAIVPLFSIGAGTPLKSSIPGASALPLGVATNILLNPSSFVPPKLGRPNQNIQLSTGGGILGFDGVSGDPLHDHVPYTAVPKITTSRYARANDILELTITNSTNAHHPFHLHGFSFQPISLTHSGAGSPYTWPFTEYRDNVNIPAQYALRIRVHISDRELADGVTIGGSLGRWLFHCHIFFHAHHGMVSELVITDPDGTGSEKPNVNVNGTWTYAPSGGIATRTGTFFHPDGDAITLTASIGTVNNLGGGNWNWQSPGGLPDQISYVYITATDPSGRRDQAVFRMKIGAPDDGSDNGDPHIHTVDGKRYDFQAVGEFMLLRDRDGMEVQVRQTPVLTANPITDPYTGIKSCVSLNTAVAARVGTHRIALQPEKENGQLLFFVDGKQARLSSKALELDGHLISSFEADGAMALRIDYLHHAVLIVTPHYWNSHNLWYLNISISHTHAEEGLMGPIPKDSWLPLLATGASVGSMPTSVSDRYTVLYKTFADSWRVTDKTSLFVYEEGNSTSTFTDKAWPAGEPPCEIKPEFEIPGAPILEGMDIASATQVCQFITEGGLKQDCVFDVATTGDEVFAKGYRITQEIRQRGTAIQIAATGSDEITAFVTPLIGNEPIFKGTVSFYVDGQKFGQPHALNSSGRAKWKVEGVDKGTYNIKADFIPSDTTANHPSTSPTLIFTLPVDTKKPDTGGTKGCLVQHWYVWILLILIALLIIWALL